MILLTIGNALNPAYAVAFIAILAALAWVLSYLVPFYRRELEVEDRTRLTPLDGLRGILCSAVMCSHAAIMYKYIDNGRWELPSSRPYALFGQISVGLFFCVTAFLFWARIVERGGLPSSWLFLRARVFRIVPLYVFSSALVVAIIAHRLDLFSASTIRGLATLGLMGVRPGGMIGDVDASMVNAKVTWTLQYEWGFYFLLPALALIVRDGGSRRLWFIAIGALVLLGLHPTLFFFPGILAVYALQTPRLVAVLRSWYASLGILALTLAFPILTPSGISYQAVVLAGLLFLPIACGNSVFGLLNFRGLRLMGITSYSFYLLHGISLYLAEPILARAKHEPSDGTLWYWFYIVICGCAALILSMLTYRFIEWPFIQAERRTRHDGMTADLVAHLVKRMVSSKEKGEIVERERA
jgi:peptidoglycan/LPS O-acetylase OafA/YrhL